MLDPRGRGEVALIVSELRRRGTAIVSITHLMGEAAAADRVVVLHRGAVMLEGTPRDVFDDPNVLHEIGLDVPVVTVLANLLRARIPTFPRGLLGVEELVDAVAARAPALR
jgi:ABC-type multidrug transport system ATPase subunit